jgi:hypothetical protein
MITGTVNADFEPIISLSIRGSDGNIYPHNAIVDTGFNGWLSLPPEFIAQLNLKWKSQGRPQHCCWGLPLRFTALLQLPTYYPPPQYSLPTCGGH